MALSDFAIFTEQLYTITTEILDQQVELFNAATLGGIVLASKPFGGDFSDKSFFGFVGGLVRRRNPYGTGAIASKSLGNLIETMVKVAAGTPVLNLDPTFFAWIKENPEIAAAVWAQQLAPQVMADMLSVAVGSVKAALGNVASTNVKDVTGATAPADLVTFANLIDTSALLGDRASDIRCWLMHSKPWFDMIKVNVANTSILFKYDTVKIFADPLGTPFVIADLPSLVVTGSPSVFSTIGLEESAVAINTNDDYQSATVDVLGDENLKQQMQSQWSYNVGVKGFTWDKANGLHAPADSALFTSSNWDKIATSARDLPGVMLKSH